MKINHSLSGALVSVIGASLCCIAPFVLLSLGISGAWISNLTALEPFRPLFIGTTILLLGFAFYKVYKKPSPEKCREGSYCANPKSSRINKISLWLVTGLASFLLVLPYILPYLYK